MNEQVEFAFCTISVLCFLSFTNEFKINIVTHPALRLDLSAFYLHNPAHVAQ